MSSTLNPPQITGQITAANVVFMLSVANLFPVPQQIQGFAPDMAFEDEDQEIAETQLGVDGGFAGGYVPVAFEQTISLLAASPSCPIFDTWWQTQKTTGQIYYGTATVYEPGVGRKITRQQGVLLRYSPIAKAGRILETRQFRIRWGQTDGAIL